ncbi:M28 family peptidase [Candidatus Harpocratesius sp.]
MPRSTGNLVNNRFIHLSPTQAKIAHSVIQIKDEDVKSCLQYTDDLIKRVGPRLAGTHQDHEAAQFLFEEMKKFGDHTHIEQFSVHPESFLSILPVLATSYLISSIFLFFGTFWLYLGVFGYLIGAFYAILQFVFYEKTFDPLYRKMKGYNVSTVIEPAGEVKQQIILSGHHDSAFIFNYIQHHPRFYTIRVLSGFLIFTITLFFALYWAIFKLFSGINPPIVNIIRFGVIIGSVIVLQYYFFKNRKGSPGAGDNLISSVMAMKIGQKFSITKSMGCYPLNHTRLIILSTDGEECGLRGASAYVRQHFQELREIPTFNINMDSIYNLKDLQIMITDINGTVRLSHSLAEEIKSLFETLGYSASLYPILFGAGGTDAAEFSKIGVDAVTILAVPTEFNDNNVVYHTSNDTVEHIEYQAVMAILSLLKEFIISKDFEIS